MGDFTIYPEFVADQVLTADHLNELFDYLDEQERLTRTCLIGIGIVCGLESLYDGNTIQITRGVGVTSKGFLIQYPDTTLMAYRPYKLPDSLNSLTPYNGFKMQLLLTSTDAKPADALIAGTASFLIDYVVVLFLEADPESLKNCTTNDCDDKGIAVTNTIRPLLVKKSDLTKFTWTDVESDKLNLSDIILSRFNVPFQSLQTADAVLNEFRKMVTPAVIHTVSEAYKDVYKTFKPYLGIAPPFNSMETTLMNIYNKVELNNRIYWQYLYDFIDDLIKAYRELVDAGNAIAVACCPDQSLFPYHLMLGEATKNSTDGFTPYRNYFIYSPLFNNQKNMVAEVVSLVNRMIQMLQGFALPKLEGAQIKINPSRWGLAPLSNRAIPYYYTPVPLVNYWNYQKTKYGKQKTNLSYSSDAYNTAPVLSYVHDPLLYELEPYNFFRIEGHLGKDYASALANLVGQRQNFSLPFDVIALNVGKSTTGFSAKDVKCYFHDLESLYKVLLSELLCKAHHPVCSIAGMQYVEFEKISELNPVLKKGVLTQPTADINDIQLMASYMMPSSGTAMSDAEMKAKVTEIQTDTIVASALNKAVYTKGTFLKKYCNAAAGTIGARYLALVNKNQSFSLPAGDPPSQNIVLFAEFLYQHYFYFIDVVEELIGTLWPNTLMDVDPDTFDNKYDAFQNETTLLSNHLFHFSTLLQNKIGIADRLTPPQYQLSFIAALLAGVRILIQLCIDDQLHALLNEWKKRFNQLQLDRIFSNYSWHHPGLDHKAGVPKGGTFILVYSEIVKEETKPNPGGNIPGSAPTPDNPAVPPDRPCPPIDASPEITETFNKLYLKFGASPDPNDLASLKMIGNALNIGLPEATQVIPIKNRQVFADFFLPYMCCSDCAPISYVLQTVKPDASVPTIGMQGDTFCNAVSSPTDVLPSPAGGVLSGPGTKPGSLQFDPVGLPVGTSVITYTLPDGTSVSKSVTIVAPKPVTFTPVYELQPDGSYKVTMTASPSDATTYAWTVDGISKYGNTAVAQDNFNFTDKPNGFTIVLEAFYDPCAPTEFTVVLMPPTQTTEIDVVKTVCFATSIPLEPNLAGGTFTWLNTNNLKTTAAGEVTFKANELKTTQVFGLQYKIVDTAGNTTIKNLKLTVVVPNTDFQIQFSKQENLLRLTFTAVNVTNETFSWITDLPVKAGTDLTVNPLVLELDKLPESGFTIKLSLRDPCQADNGATIKGDPYNALIKNKKILNVIKNKVTVQS